MPIEMMIFIGGLVIGLGVILSALYYFARYKFLTDHEEDRAREITAVPDEEALVAPRPAPQAEVLTPRSQEVLEKPPAPPARPTVVPPAAVPPAPATLDQALSKTRDTFWGRLKSVFTGKSLDPAHVEAIEEILYTSDLGPRTVQRLMDSIQENSQRLATIEDLKAAFKIEFHNILTPVKAMGESPLDKTGHHPQVWMIVGVNGVGKTTTIGKLAFAAAKKGLKVLVAAGDTFRAAAQEQLKIWTERAQVEIFAPAGVTDPGAVAYDAFQMAKSRAFDLVLIDTAGRLHTQKNLMEELKKVKRVLQKITPEIPHEILIVLDANSGQNALVQAREFHAALELTGAVVTKMDGTAKGGVVLGLAEELRLPTRLIGVGEGVTDLKNFSVDEYVSSILG